MWCLFSLWLLVILPCEWISDTAWLRLQNIFYPHVEILRKTFRSNPRILLTVIADCRKWFRTSLVIPRPIFVNCSAVLLWVVIVRLSWSPVVEISTSAEICVSHWPLPSGQVIAKPNPCTSATSLQYTHQPVAFFHIFHSGKISEHLSAVALSFGPGLWHLYIVVLSDDVWRQSRQPWRKKKRFSLTLMYSNAIRQPCNKHKYCLMHEWSLPMEKVRDNVIQQFKVMFSTNMSLTWEREHQQ